MNVEKLTSRITLRPSDRKIKKAKHVAEQILPKTVSVDNKQIMLSDSISKLGKFIKSSFDNITKRGQ